MNTHKKPTITNRKSILYNFIHIYFGKRERMMKNAFHLMNTSFFSFPEYLFLRQHTVHILLWCERVTLKPFEWHTWNGFITEYRMHNIAHTAIGMHIANSTCFGKVSCYTNPKSFFVRFMKKIVRFFPDCRKNSSGKYAFGMPKSQLFSSIDKNNREHILFAMENENTWQSFNV